MERALITGVAGFIGSHLAAELLRRGWSVTGLDARSPASDPVAAENLAELTGDPRFQFVPGATGSARYVSLSCESFLFWALWILIDAALPTAGSSSGSEIAHVDGRHRPTPVSTYPNIEVDFDDEGRGADVELEDRGEVIDEPFAPALIDVQALTPTVNLLLAAPQWCPRPPSPIPRARAGSRGC